MSEIIKRIHDMHALAADACDPAYNQLLLDAADEIKWLWTEHNEWKQAAGVEAGLRRELQADNARLQAALKQAIGYADAIASDEAGRVVRATRITATAINAQSSVTAHFDVASARELVGEQKAE